MTLIMCYSPTEVPDDNKKDSFYRKLGDTFNSVPSYDTVMVIGDMNAKVGCGSNVNSSNPSIGSHGMGTRNDNGTSSQLL